MDKLEEWVKQQGCARTLFERWCPCLTGREGGPVQLRRDPELVGGKGGGGG